MLGGILLGIAVFQSCRRGQSRVAAGKRVAILSAGLLVLVSDLANSPGSRGLRVLWVVLCVAGAFWSAFREQKGKPLRPWVLGGVLVGVAILVDVVSVGGPGPWWEAAQAELQRWPKP